ncbi:MAG: Dabb family protein [Bacteroidaceae bacterium]|nr:Dabb family protein [Bacteroidaceae bacterium]
MKNLKLLPLFILVCTFFSACSKQEDKPEKLLRHVVLFGFDTTVTADQVKEIEDAFQALPKQIEQIKDYEWGTDCSPEGLQKGLTHCFFVTFHSEKDRNDYLVHPAHQAFGKLINGKLSAITVVDYWVK